MKAKRSIQTLSTCKPIVGGLLALTLALGLSLGNGLPSFASISQDDRLAKLEVKFFKHTYPKDDDGARLERLEKMIFGETRSGNDDDRLKNLASTVPNLNEVPTGVDASSAAGASADATSRDAASKSMASDGSELQRAASSGSSQADNSAPGGESPKKVSHHSSGKHDRNRPKSSEGSSTASANANLPGESGVSASDEADSAGGSAAHKVLAGESKYPAVTALEQYLFNRDYATEAVGDRLNRLETKVFGKPSRFTDLSERVDSLKEKTNVDIAKRPPAGTDFVDDDEDNGQAFPVPKRSEPIARTDGDDGRSFSGRDVGQDLRKAFGRAANNYLDGQPAGQSSGAYGMAGTSAGRSGSNSAAGSYGMGSSNIASASGASRPRAAKTVGPSVQDDDDTDRLPVTNNPIGLNQQVTRLENAVLGKTYNQEPLIDRVARLEKKVFPKEADAQSTLAMPARVARLVQKIPIAAQPAITSAGGGSRYGSGSSSSSSSRRPSGWIDEDSNLGFAGGSGGGSGSDESFATGQTGMGAMNSMGMGSSMGSGMGMSGGMAQQTAQQPKGLSKIINSIGNAMGGGFTGGYNVNSGMMRTDPATGLLVDTMTGNLINPTTGAVVGRSAAYSGAPMYSGVQMGGMPMGMGGMGMGGMGMGMGMGGLGMGGMPYRTGLGMPYGSVYGGGMPMGGMGGFNNGFSPYGMGGTGGYSVGGGRFGGGGMGQRIGF